MLISVSQRIEVIEFFYQILRLILRFLFLVFIFTTWVIKDASETSLVALAKLDNLLVFVTCCVKAKCFLWNIRFVLLTICFIWEIRRNCKLVLVRTFFERHNETLFFILLLKSHNLVRRMRFFWFMGVILFSVNLHRLFFCFDFYPFYMRLVTS